MNKKHGGAGRGQGRKRKYKVGIRTKDINIRIPADREKQVRKAVDEVVKDDKFDR